ncbi:MAG TPA: hypothetical protein V6D17_15040, partial [Candidatus Obscuribacterales bacterium]
MSNAHFAYQPTLRQLLHAEALGEAQIFYGEESLDRTVTQVVSFLSPASRAGSLFVNRQEALQGKEAGDLKDLAGVILIRPFGEVGSPPAPGAELLRSAAPATPVLAPALGLDALLKRLIAVCTEAEVPLIVLPGFGDPGQIADEVRLAFLRQLKLNNTTLHADLLTIAIEEGLEELVETVSNYLNRPVVLETAEYQLLASKNMGGTPASQQRALSEEIFKTVRRVAKLREKGETTDVCVPAVKVGRRLVVPVLLGDAVVGYISSMVRSNDDTDAIAEFLRPAALAAMVDFNQRRKDSSIFAATQKSLLKDLLSGHTLSASDQERLDQHYGFDL